MADEKEASLTEALEDAARAGSGLSVEPGGVEILAATLRRHHDNIVSMRADVERIRDACDRLLEKLPADGFRMYAPRD